MIWYRELKMGILNRFFEWNQTNGPIMEDIVEIFGIVCIIAVPVFIVVFEITSGRQDY